MPNIVRHFERTNLKDVQLSSQVVVETGTTVHDTVLAMANADTSCAFVMNGKSVVGIFTEHDVAHRVVDAPDVWQQPIEALMTPDPHVVSGDDSALDALRAMRNGGFRNVPVLLNEEGLYANVTHFDLIRLASRYLEAEPGEEQTFTAEHALRFVDFYGMHSRVPLEVTIDTTLEEVVRLMRSHNRGLISVVDDRGILIGEFTQYDVFLKVACRLEDLADYVVGDWMTSEFATVLPSAKIADGLHVMAEKRHRYLVLTNETGRSIGLVTFRDIAEFFEAAFAVA